MKLLIKSRVSLVDSFTLESVKKHTCSLCEKICNVKLFGDFKEVPSASLEK